MIYSIMQAVSPGEIASHVDELIEVCRRAWQEGLMAGWSGNASARLGDSHLFLLTRAGAAKGSLEPEDFVTLDTGCQLVSGKARPSSEYNLHAAIYACFDACKVILHTHPPHLQALNLALTRGSEAPDADLRRSFLSLDLHEARMWRRHLAIAPDFTPGSAGLANAALEALKTQLDAGIPASEPCAVWMAGHGLCALGQDPASCLCLSEELEHLARVQLLCRQTP